MLQHVRFWVGFAAEKKRRQAELILLLLPYEMQFAYSRTPPIITCFSVNRPSALVALAARLIFLEPANGCHKVLNLAVRRDFAGVEVALDA
jgi:hypothetical protein